MKTEIEKRSGECPTHGRVEGTREVPRLQFPYLVTGLLRYRARRGPFACPTCGAPLKTA